MLSTLKCLLIALALSAMAATAGHAQKRPHKREPGTGVPQAFAMVQAPEAAVETCHGSTPRAAQACALAKCRKKAGRGACYAVTVCAPNGWAGVMGVKVKEVHFSQSVCGAPNREALLTALKAFCRGHIPNLEQCTVDEVFAPNGKPEKVDQTWLAKDLQ